HTHCLRTRRSSDRRSRRAHISQLGRGPDASDHHGTSDGPDNLRPLPNPLPRRERELFWRGLLILSWPKACTLLYPNYTDSAVVASRQDVQDVHTSPLPLWGEGPGERARCLRPPRNL